MIKYKRTKPSWPNWIWHAVSARKIEGSSPSEGTMLVFIDGSGDSGLKIEKGSSRFFTIALVIFEEKEEAEFCDQRIQLLKKELGWQI